MTAYSSTLVSATVGPDHPTELPRQLHQDPTHRAVQWLAYLHYASPLLLLFFFLLVFTARSIWSASNHNANATDGQLTGPGGKPLPGNTKQQASLRRDRAKDDITHNQKLLFEWVSVLTAFTFIGNAATVILHALINRKEGYWCGQAYVVRISLDTVTLQQRESMADFLCL